MSQIVDIIASISFVGILICAYFLLGQWYEKISLQAEKAVKRYRRQKRIRAFRSTITWPFRTARKGVMWPVRKLGLIKT